MFVDNCVLFGRAKVEEWIKMQGLLLSYEKVSDQFFNKNKIVVFFSTNTKAEDKRKI